MKNIETSFRQLRLFGIVYLCACTLLVGFSLWKDYGFAEAKTAYGRLGVKVWIYKGQVLPTVKKAPAKTEGGK